MGYSHEELTNLNSEFRRLKGHHYLDHAGATLYSESLIKAVHENFISNVYCNPHTSKTTEDLIDQVRFRILNHFNTDSSEYNVIFTSGTTASLKLVAETFDFNGNGHFIHLRDSHTSVLGMREIVGTDKIDFIERDNLLTMNKNVNTKHKELRSLLVFPAQCNFNGFKYPLELIDNIHINGLGGYENHELYICLDAASFVSTNYLNLKKYRPDFVCVSFYKIFGYPTGLGALLVSKRGESILYKKYYGGGTVQIAMSSENWHVKRNEMHERFEDGTIPFLSIVSLLQGFENLAKLVPEHKNLLSIQRVSQHTFQLGKYLFEKLASLKHSNGSKVVEMYHDTNFESADTQGGIINFNVMHDDGTYVGFAEIACMANLHNIYLRTGCFCNPGACQRLLELSDEDVRRHFQSGHICGDSNDLVDGQPTGSVRVSFGYMTTKEDVDAIYTMILNCYARKTDPVSLNRIEIHENYKVYKDKARVKLKTICIYPIKSCGAFKIQTKWPLTVKGLKYDREWMIVDDNGVALTQKKETKLCLLRPTIDDERGIMTLNYPGVAAISIHLVQELTDTLKSAKLCQTKICRDNIVGIDCGDKVADFISSALSISGLRLIKQCDDNQRIVKSTEKAISLSNQAQYLMINQTSVQWLARKVEDWDDLIGHASLEGFVDRFRGNLIIETSNHLEEMNWQHLNIGSIRFNVDGPCTRCQMICIDQYTGEKTSEPLKTIAKEFKGKMKFGIYLSQANYGAICEQYINCDDFIQEFLE